MESSDHDLHCPKCHYAVIKYEWETAIADYPCPRCGKAKLLDFLNKAELLSEAIATSHPEWFD